MTFWKNRWSYLVSFEWIFKKIVLNIRLIHSLLMNLFYVTKYVYEF